MTTNNKLIVNDPTITDKQSKIISEFVEKKKKHITKKCPNTISGKHLWEKGMHLVRIQDNKIFIPVCSACSLVDDREINRE